MKILATGAALFLALAAAGCSAGVSVGSATYSADERGETLCTNSYGYGASVAVPDTQHGGVRRQGGCVSREIEADD